MLDKPNNPTPYNTVVDAGSVVFSASCINTNEITNLRLIIDDGNYKYYSKFLTTGVEQVEIGNGEIKITFNTNLFNGGYKISNSNYERSDISTLTLSNNKKYTWQLRLYTNNKNVNIGYGFIQAVSSGTSDYEKTLKMRPHTNMFWNKDTQGIDKSLIKYFDDKVSYVITINGISADVKSYYYKKADKDSYGNPLFSYADIEFANTIDAEDILVEQNDEYSIYTNYIDSNEFYFQTRKKATLSIKADNETGNFGFVEGVDYDGEDVSIAYSNLVLRGTFTSRTSTVSYYRFMLYQIIEGKDDVLVKDTGNIYNSLIEFKYDDLLPQTRYYLVVNVTDTDNKTICQCVIFKTEYNVVVQPRDFNIDYFPEHGSVILDVGDLISISGHLKKGSADGDENDIKYNRLKAEYNDEDGTYDIIIDESEEDMTTLASVDVDVHSCTIPYSDEYIEYNKTDNGEVLSFDDFVFSTVFKCGRHKSAIPIFEIVSDSGRKYGLFWDRYRFLYQTAPSENLTYSSVIAIPVYKNYPKNIAFSSSTDYKAIVNNITLYMEEENDDYHTPHILFPEVEITNSSYIHTENIAEDCWWQVIVTPLSIYLKCLNPPPTWEQPDGWVNKLFTTIYRNIHISI